MIATSGRTELEIRGVTKRFSSARLAVTALDDIHLEITRSSFVSLIGTSGCGKTTLLRILAGLEQEYEGVVELEGQPVRQPGPDKGVVFQDHRLLPWLTIDENIGFGLIHHSAREREAVTEHYRNLVGLRRFGRSYPNQVSGGMAQRAAIARALVNRPKVLLLDEPFGALDALTRLHMHGELESIWRAEQTTMVMVTHDVEEAIFLSDLVVLMSPRPGRIVRKIPVLLPRPRDREHPEFLAIRREILHAFSLQAEAWYGEGQ